MMNKILRIAGITIALTAMGVAMRASIYNLKLNSVSEKNYRNILNGKKTINQIRQENGLAIIDQDIADKRLYINSI